METKLQNIHLKNFETASGKLYDLPVSYELFGRELHTAPVVLVNHALTGNSNVAGEKGWWKTLVGDGEIIDTQKFTVLSFNIPGNGYNGFFIENYQDFTTEDIAKIFLQTLDLLRIKTVYAVIGGSIGGAIAWEMLAQSKNFAEHVVALATDYKTSDWLHAQCLVQKFLLESPEEPLQKARIHAMLCYRTPESLNLRFKNEFDVDKNLLKSHDWLNYHGRALNERFSLKAYKLMNNLLMTINTPLENIKGSRAKICLTAVDTDLFFPAFEIKKTYEALKNDVEIQYTEIQSIHGHDAFLMEYEQLRTILKPIFNYD